ncbi:hypothetical protein SOVF_116990 [Spinacia oleracea]|nr:hypothetical protein SOVF_116990 [Spinacia oleracea]
MFVVVVVCDFVVAPLPRLSFLSSKLRDVAVDGGR